MAKKDRPWRKGKPEQNETTTGIASDPLSPFLDQNLRNLEKYFQGGGLVTGKVALLGGLAEAGVAYIDGLVNVVDLNEHLIAPLPNGNPALFKNKPKTQWLRIIRTHLIANINVTETNDLDELSNQILRGRAALLVDGIPSALVIGAREFEMRGIEKPGTEVTLHGSRDSFTEDLTTNCMLIRKRLPTPGLQFKELMLGRLSQTKVRTCWIEGVANQALLREVEERLARIDVDSISTIGMIAELIEDAPLSIFPQYRKTERPDRVAANLAEGRIAILADGFPFVLIVPVIILQELQTVDDYAEKPLVGTLLRTVRYLAIFISVMMSPLYLSFVTYNHTIIPPSLAQQIAMGREGLPFPSLVEVILVTGLIDVFREAGLRMPATLGGAISVLGAVVIGQAAVTAGYFSPSAIIIMSITAISAFAIPSTTLASATRVLNYFLIFLAGIAGFFGVVLGAILITWRLTVLRSFGVTLSYPLERGQVSLLKDLMVRAPFWKLRKRPGVFTENQTRMGETTQKPTPPQTDPKGENRE